MTKLRIGYFYPEELNLYGDTGNIEVLVYRAKQRKIDVYLENISMRTALSGSLTKMYDLVFMGGGPDSSQKQLYNDLIHNKGPLLKEYIENNGVSLFICGSYQLLGHYYKSLEGSVADGTALDIKGVSALDLYTVHHGHKSKRCVGNIICELDPHILNDPIFRAVNRIGSTLVGFENHGGRTYLNSGMTPMAKVKYGFGNNLEDKTEGVHYKNTIGTYMHGPFLSKNPHIADYLIAKAVNAETLERLPIDDIIEKSHTALINRFK